jgi:hypothetical protein
VAGDPDNFDIEGADVVRGAFVPPILLHCAIRFKPPRCIRSRHSAPSVR